MKKALKKEVLIGLICFVIGTLLASGIAVYATISASGINYTKQGTNIQNVSQALNDLYTKTKYNSGTTTIANNSLSIPVESNCNRIYLYVQKPNNSGYAIQLLFPGVSGADTFWNSGYFYTDSGEIRWSNWYSTNV